MSRGRSKPTERKLCARIYSAIFGVWPQRVANERLEEDEEIRPVWAIKAERERQGTMATIREHGAASTIYISHGASGDWFVVEPQVGTQQSIVNTPITLEMAVRSLVDSGRTVFMLENIKLFGEGTDEWIVRRLRPGDA